MTSRVIDWLLIGLAILAAGIGYVAGPPWCYQSFGPGPASTHCDFRFPIEFAIGIALALVLVAAWVVRRRGRTG